MEIRQSRKLDHIRCTLSMKDQPEKTGFSEVHLIHNCLPEIDFAHISLKTDVGGCCLDHPIILNAMTGGAQDVARVNENLAVFARETRSAMAVGSQCAALERPEVQSSYQIVRRVNPKGIIFANLGSYASPDDAERAVDMIEAQALQIHLNAGQEIMMPEGDRNFQGALERISKICSTLSVPVIVKEVGCGVAKEQVALLAQTGAKVIDVGGFGGTNFMAIEASRSPDFDEELTQWGIPTVISVLEAKSVLSKDMDIIVSGGVRQASDIVKSLILGGKAVAIAGSVLREIETKSLDETISAYQHKLEALKKYLFLLGVTKISDLKTSPYVLSGFVHNWAKARCLTSQD